jgi:hypothetical protein
MALIPLVVGLLSAFVATAAAADAAKLTRRDLRLRKAGGPLKVLHEN